MSFQSRVIVNKNGYLKKDSDGSIIIRQIFCTTLDFYCSLYEKLSIDRSLLVK